VRAAAAARLLLGGVCLGAPGVALDHVGGPDRDDPITLVVARILGARLVVQGLADLALGDRLGSRVRRVDITVDLAHAASMVPVMLRWPQHRRTAAVSALAAVTTAVLDLRAR
jgi:hypothetical protein